MFRKTIAIVIIAAAFTLLYFVPIPQNVSFSMSGSIRSAEGDILSPCTVTFDGSEIYSLFRNKQNELKGRIYLIDDSQTINSYAYLYVSSLSNGGSTPGGKLNVASGTLYRGKILGSLPCSVYFTDDRSTYVILYNGGIYCVSSLSEAEFMEVFNKIAQHAAFAG